MTKQKILLFVNVILIFSALIQALSGLSMAFGIKLPHFTHEMHKFNGPLLVLLIVTHTILNWSWVRLNLLPK